MIAVSPKLFPTPVGMFRGVMAEDGVPCPFPHACGDVPGPHPMSLFRSIFSPRLWGCSAIRRRRRGFFMLFPTPVGMFRA